MSSHKSIDNKLTVGNVNHFQNLIYSEESDVVFVNETWLNNNIDNSEILHSGYTIFRNDRETRGGGVLLAIKTDSFKSVREVKNNHKYNLEIVLAEVLTSSNTTLLFCSCYRPPDADQIWLNNFSNFLGDICSHYENIVLAGDFNMPHVCWNCPEMNTGVNEVAFVELLNDYYIAQLNTTPTRGDNVLDLVLTNTPNLVNIREIWSPTEANIFTDHSIVAFDILVSPKVSTKIQRTVYDYRRGDFDALRSHLDSLNMSSLISVDGDIDQDWLHWKDTFLTAVHDYIPTKKLRGRNYIPWMNNEILHNIKKKNSIRRRLKKSSKPSDYLQQKLKTIRATIKRMMNESRSNYINSLCTETNPKRFWSLFKLKSKDRTVPSKISINDSLYAENSTDIANLFNRYFTSIFTTDPNNEDTNSVDQPHNYSSDTTSINDINLSVETVFLALKNLDNNKAHGPDQIPARLLTETASQIAPSLCILFNKSLQTGTVPRDWKLANVVPIYKNGNKEHAGNYRPISLLSLVSKVLERSVFNNIKDRVFSQINSYQHGFITGRSCVTQLIEVLDNIGRQLDRGKQIDVIYLDMSKAFDKVSHRRLLLRLRDFGFGGSVLKWFGSYLKDRRQQTTVLGATSTPLPVTSGVPQGSILGPLLFLLYTNNLSDSIVNSNIAAFADDTKIFKEINCQADAASLQKDLSKFEISSSDAGLHLNILKCKTIHITRKHNKIEYPYKLQNTALEKTDCERDLGVWTTNNLTWSKQVSVQSNKANKLLGYIRRSTKNIKNFSIRRTLYLALVRSQLGYASQVWAPQTIELITRIERVQRRASKYILDLPFICDTDYKERLLFTKLLPLSYWHEYLDVLFFYKATHGINILNKNIQPTSQNHRQTRSSDSNCCKYQIKKCNTSTHQKSYINRTTRIWNTLPKSIIKKTVTLTNFKHLLFNHYILALQNTYNIDDPRTWKSVCLKCNTARNLTKPLSCCF